MSKYGKLYPVSFGFAWGLLSGLACMLLAWMAMRWSFGLPLVHLLSHIYRGYGATWLGGFWGFCWGFLHSFIFGFLIALVYNCCSKCFCPSGECD